MDGFFFLKAHSICFNWKEKDLEIDQRNSPVKDYFIHQIMD